MAKNQKKRADRLRREQEAMNHVLNIFLAGIIAEFYLLFMQRRFIRGTAHQVVAAATALKVIGILGAVAFAAGLVLLLMKKARLRKLAGWLTGAGAFFAVANTLIYVVYPRGAQMLCALVPIVMVLGMVFFLFQKEFFLSALVLGGTMFSLWVQMRGLGTAKWNVPVIAGSVVVMIALAAVAWGVKKLQGSEGKYHCARAGRDVRVFSATCSYKALYLVLAVAAAAIVLGLLVPSILYYLMWAVGVFFFAAAVYYTTKLM